MSNSGTSAAGTPARQTKDDEIATAIPCYLPRCNGHLVRKTGTHGIFFGCTEFRRTGCTATMNYEAAEEMIAVRVYGVTFDRNEPHYGE